MQPGFERVVAAQPAARRSSVAQTVAMAAAVLALVGVVAHTVSWCAERPGVRWGRAGAGCTLWRSRAGGATRRAPADANCVCCCLAPCWVSPLWRLSWLPIAMVPGWEACC